MVEVQVKPAGHPAAAVGFLEHRVTTERYLKMVRLGIFGRGDRVFLWHGRLVEQMTKGRPHSYAALKLNKLLDGIVPAEWHVELEQPMDLGDDSLPEPDLMVLRGPLEHYETRIPTPRDVTLIIEVADSSVAEDRGPVLLDYALAQIPIYWLVNIPKRRVEVYEQPTNRADGPCYAIRLDYGPGQAVPVVLQGDRVGLIAVDEIFPA